MRNKPGNTLCISAISRFNSPLSSLSITGPAGFYELIFNANSMTSPHGNDQPNKILTDMFGNAAGDSEVEFSIWEFHSTESPEYEEPVTLKLSIPYGADLTNGYYVDLHVFTVSKQIGAGQSGNLIARVRAAYRSHSQPFNANPDPVNEEAFSDPVTIIQPANTASPFNQVNTNHYVVTTTMSATNANPRDFCLLVFDRADDLDGALDTAYISSAAIRFPAAS